MAGLVPKNFSSPTEFEVVKTIKCGKPEAPLLHIYFGPYVCHGKIHHDTHRLTQFIQALLHHHYDVELHHEEADAIRVDECSAGFVKVTNSHGVQLFYCPDFQDDTNAPHYETFAIEMAKEVMHAVRSIGK